MTHQRKQSPVGAWALDTKDKAVHAVTRHPVTTAVIAAVLAGLLGAAGTAIVQVSVSEAEDAHRDKAIAETASGLEHVRVDAQTTSVKVYRLEGKVESLEERIDRQHAETMERLGQVDSCLREACWRAHR